MIRDFRLTYKLNCIFNSSFELFHNFMRTFNSKKVHCSSCGSKHPHWQYHASYPRYLIDFYNNQIVVNTITITRLQCSSCDHTHAILPDFLIPYSSYSLTFVLNVLDQFFSKMQTVKALCLSFQISHSTLYAWVKLFRMHKKLWLGVLEDMILMPSEFLNSLFEFKTHPPKSNFLASFYEHFKFSFLQGVSKTATFNSS